MKNQGITGNVANAFFAQREERDKRIIESKQYKDFNKKLENEEKRKEEKLDQEINDGSNMQSKLSIPTKKPEINQITNGRKLSGEHEKLRISFKR